MSDVRERLERVGAAESATLVGDSARYRVEAGMAKGRGEAGPALDDDDGPRACRTGESIASTSSSSCASTAAASSIASSSSAPSSASLRSLESATSSARPSAVTCRSLVDWAGMRALVGSLPRAAWRFELRSPTRTCLSTTWLTRGFLALRGELAAEGAGDDSLAAAVLERGRPRLAGAAAEVEVEADDAGAESGLRFESALDDAAFSLTDDVLGPM